MRSPSQVITEQVDFIMQANQEEKGDSWQDQSIKTHLNHAWAHLTMYDAPAQQEDHLAHAATRLAMALALREAEEIAWENGG
jgi:hypothetical protein